MATIGYLVNKVLHYYVVPNTSTFRQTGVKGNLWWWQRLFGSDTSDKLQQPHVLICNLDTLKEKQRFSEYVNIIPS